MVVYIVFGKIDDDRRKLERGGELMQEIERKAIIQKGDDIDIDISKISSCSQHSLADCEKYCSRYYGCQTVAYANDLIVEFEEK